MTLADVTAHWPTIAAIAGGMPLGGAFTKWLDYKTKKQGQTDQVSISLVIELRARITEVEQNAAKRIDDVEKSSSQERELCDAKLSGLQHQLNTVTNSFDSLMLAIEIAPEKAAEVVAKIKARRSIDADPGERRQQAQKSLSEARVLRDEP